MDQRNLHDCANSGWLTRLHRQGAPVILQYPIRNTEVKPINFRRAGFLRKGIENGFEFLRRRHTAIVDYPNFNKTIIAGEYQSADSARESG